jgi:hypothetical protein
MKKLDLATWGPMTALVAVVIVLFVVGGIVCAVIGGDAYKNFLQLASLAWKFAGSASVLGLARALHFGLTNTPPAARATAHKRGHH